MTTVWAAKTLSQAGGGFVLGGHKGAPRASWGDFRQWANRHRGPGTFVPAPALEHPLGEDAIDHRKGRRTVNDVGEGTEPTFVFAGGAKYLARLPASFNASLASKSGFEGTGPMYLAAFDHGGARPGSGTAGHLVDDEFSIPSGASRPPKNYRNFSGEAPSPSAYDHP